jgi:RNA polymerase sigma factor for flagellar operon FliA
MREPLTDQEIEDLILSHIALAISIARRVYRTAPHALELDELEAIAKFGLVDAGKRWNAYCKRKGYDPKAIAFFTKFSSLRINGAIFDRLRSNDWATRSLREKSRRINYTLNLEEQLTVKELSDRTGLSEKEVRDTLIGMSRAPISLDTASHGLENESGESVGLQVAEPEGTESQVAVNATLDAFADAVRELPIEERLIVVLHYHQGMELKKAAQLLNITDAAASAIHTHAVFKLLHVLEEAVS